MRALKLLSILLLVPSLASAWGGYYGDKTPKRNKHPAAGDKISIGTDSGNATLGSTGINGHAAAAGVTAAPQGGTVASTATASAPIGAGLGTTVRSLLDPPPAQNTGSAAAASAAAGLSQGQINSLLGNAGSALGGAGMGGAAGSGGACPSNMHSVGNGLGGQNCVAGAPK